MAQEWVTRVVLGTGCDRVEAAPCGRPILGMENGRAQGPAPTRYLSLSNVIERFKSLTTTRYIDGVETGEWDPSPGKLWNTAQQGETNAAYGKQLIERLSEALSNRLGSGSSERNLYRMRQFYLARKISPQPAKLSWPIIEFSSRLLN